MKQFTVKQIGTIELTGEETFVQVEEEWIPALQGLEGFGHLNLIWWFDGCDDERDRRVLQVSRPYQKSPEVLGTFATRSPQRPNPIALSVVSVLGIDIQVGRIQIAYTDAAAGSPVLDLKPYEPSLDRVEYPQMPDWCAHWPKSLEESGEFDWKNEFNF